MILLSKHPIDIDNMNIALCLNTDVCMIITELLTPNDALAFAYTTHILFEHIRSFFDSLLYRAVHMYSVSQKRHIILSINHLINKGAWSLDAMLLANYIQEQYISKCILKNSPTIIDKKSYNELVRTYVPSPLMYKYYNFPYKFIDQYSFNYRDIMHIINVYSRSSYVNGYWITEYRKEDVTDYNDKRIINPRITDYIKEDITDYNNKRIILLREQTQFN